MATLVAPRPLVFKDGVAVVSDAIKFDGRIFPMMGVITKDGEFLANVCTVCAFITGNDETVEKANKKGNDHFKKLVEKSSDLNNNEVLLVNHLEVSEHITQSLLDPIVDPILDPIVDPILDPIVDAILEPNPFLF